MEGEKFNDMLRLDPGQIEVLDEAMVKALRHKTPAERIQIGFTLWISAKNILTNYLRQSNSDWDAQKIDHEVAKRLSHGAKGIGVERNLGSRAKKN